MGEESTEKLITMNGKGGYKEANIKEFIYCKLFEKMKNGSFW